MHSEPPDSKMLVDDDGYTLGELCDLAGVTQRTVRYYIQQGLLPAATRSGPGVRYPASMLKRLKFIRLSQEDGRPLARIRDELERLGPDFDDSDPSTSAQTTPSTGSNAALDYLARLRGQPPAPPRPAPVPPPPAAPTPAELQLSRSTWERIAIDTNMELHIRRPLSVAENRRLDRLLAAIATIFDPSNHTP
jgi:DNA-binding transcriptional MerR regulator